MFRIRRFGVIRTANVVALLYAVIIAVIVVPLVVIVALIAPKTGATGSVGAVSLLLIGLLAAVFYALLGWIFTAVACLFYNFAAGLVGGVEIELEAVQPRASAKVWTGLPSAPSAEPPAESPPAG